MDRFGYPFLLEKLSGSKIHSLDNVMTLSSEVHLYFSQLRLWFEAMVSIFLRVRNIIVKKVYQGNPNEYKVCLVDSSLANFLGIPSTVTFKVADEASQDCSILPSSTYLYIHAACSKVAHLSGAGEHIDKVHLRDLEEIVVLAEDGVSGLCRGIGLRDPAQPDQDF